MKATNKNDNVTKERKDVTLGSINIYRKINSDTRKREWDFSKGCWRDRPRFKGGWDLRFSN